MQLRAAPRVCWQVNRLRIEIEDRQARQRQRVLDGTRPMASLSSRSHRPHRVRQRCWQSEQVTAVERLRRHYPNWRKQKLRTPLQREGMVVSESSIGEAAGAEPSWAAAPATAAQSPSAGYHPTHLGHQDAA